MFNNKTSFIPQGDQIYITAKNEFKLQLLRTEKGYFTFSFIETFYLIKLSYAKI